RLRYRTRRLCKPHATTITKSDHSSLVLRKMSFTMRERFTPARACSTRTRTRDSLRLWRFWPRVNAPLRGFFSVDGSGALGAHTPETRCPYTGSCRGDSQSVQYPRSFCHAFFPHMFDSNTRPVWSWHSPPRCSYHCASCACHCSARLVLPCLSGADGDGPCRR